MLSKSLVPCFSTRLPPTDRAIEFDVMGSVQALQVSAKLGGTQGKKAAKTGKKAVNTVKKTLKQNVGKAKSTAKQSKNKAVTKSGAGNWYGPDRPKFLGMSCSAPLKSFDVALSPTLCPQAPSLHLLHTFLESLLETTDGTRLVCQQTPPHLSDTGTSRSFTLDGPCLVLLVRSSLCHSDSERRFALSLLPSTLE